MRRLEHLIHLGHDALMGYRDIEDGGQLIFEEAKTSKDRLPTGKRKRLLEHATEREAALFSLIGGLLYFLADALQLLLCLDVTLNADFCYKLSTHQCHLLIPISDLLPLGLAVQVVQSFELPPLRHVHEFPRLAVAVFRDLEAYPVLRWLPK